MGLSLSGRLKKYMKTEVCLLRWLGSFVVLHRPGAAKFAVTIRDGERVNFDGADDSRGALQSLFGTSPTHLINFTKSLRDSTTLHFSCDLQ